MEPMCPDSAVLHASDRIIDILACSHIPSHADAAGRSVSQAAGSSAPVTLPISMQKPNKKL